MVREKVLRSDRKRRSGLPGSVTSFFFSSFAFDPRCLVAADQGPAPDRIVSLCLVDHREPLRNRGR